MKKRYEKFENINLFCILFLLFVVVSIFFLNQRRIIVYKTFSAISYDKNVIVLVVDNSDLELFFKNRKLYIDLKKISFEIQKIDKNILERKGDKYSRIYIKVNTSNLYEVNDVVEVSIMDRKVKTFNIFKIIWDGD